MTTTFTVARDNLRVSRWLESEPAPLREGEVRLGIDAFALTSNNITYAAFGEAMSYWNFFATSDPKTGCIPVWGFATVVESRCPGIEPGERLYGYLPMADEVVLQPGRIDAAGFVDAAPHRRELHAVYNRYLRCAADPIVRRRARGRAGAAAALVHDLFPDRRLSRRQRVLRGTRDRAVERIEQDGLRHRLLPGTAQDRAGQRGAGRRPDVAGPSELHAQPRLLRRGPAPTTTSIACRPKCRASTST